LSFRDQFVIELNQNLSTSNVQSSYIRMLKMELFLYSMVGNHLFYQLFYQLAVML